MSTTDTSVNELIINTLTKAQYDDLVNNSQVSSTELYLTKDEDYYTKISVIYGTTTYAQITSILSGKSEPVCNYNSYNYTYAGNDGTYYYLTCAINNEIKYVRVNSSNMWSTGSAIIPIVNNNTVTVVTDADNTDLAIQANRIYKFTNALSTLTLTSAEVSDYESMVYFDTSSSITFTDNSTLKWGGGSIPSLDTNTTYCIAIKNGLAELDKFGR